MVSQHPVARFKGGAPKQASSDPAGSRGAEAAGSGNGPQDYEAYRMWKECQIRSIRCFSSDTQEIAARAALTLLALPLVPEHAARRARGLDMLLATLAGQASEWAADERSAYLEAARPHMTAAEQVDQALMQWSSIPPPAHRATPWDRWPYLHLVVVDTEGVGASHCRRSGSGRRSRAAR